MGSRGRSIRLRIYFLVAVPLVTMVGLLAYVSWTTVDNAINLDRAPNLINDTSEPTADFIALLQNERRAAVVYLFQPTAANRTAYDATVNATNAGVPVFKDKMTSAGTLGSAMPDEITQINKIVAGLPQLDQLRDAVRNRTPGLTALAALQQYNQGSTQMVSLFVTEADSMTNTTLATQALGLIETVEARDLLSQEDALVAGFLVSGHIPPADRAYFAQIAGANHAITGTPAIPPSAQGPGSPATTGIAQAMLSPDNIAVFNQYLNQDQQQKTAIANVENAISAGAPIQAVAAQGLTPATWQAVTGKVLTDNFNGGKKTATAELAQGKSIASSAWLRVALSSGAGLVGLILTIILTTITGRGIIKRLRRLETSALTLAEQQLPDVIARLRRGDEVDVAAEAPPLRIGGDEIGRVGQAFDLVRQTAVRAAVEEAKLRRGLNDVFRSLARRSQSLLHRQLTLLDQMERRATDPEALDDLFRLDHLTTRMRRHAEGLIILAGAPAGRGWSSPVRMVDVMRGAIAEVEDYARVSVVSRSQAALSGSAVADVIHLLAELIENATTLSPPYTSVRVSGETVGNGFAIEVEDRGLGMSQHRLAELNERLANPPEFNPSDSEQLGLFVVSQLAKRHGIRVTLKASPYGGTEAVVLVPRQLVVADEGARASLPTGAGPSQVIDGALVSNGSRPMPSAELPGAGAPYVRADAFDGDPLGSGPLRNGTAGNGAFGTRNGSSGPGPAFGGAARGDDAPPAGNLPAFGGAAPFGDSTPFTAGPRISGPMRRSRGDQAEGQPHGTHHAPRRERRGANGNGSLGPPAPEPFAPEPFAPEPFAAEPFAPEPFAPEPFGGSEAFSDTPLSTEDGELPRRNRGKSGAAGTAGAHTFDVFKPRLRGDGPGGPEPELADDDGPSSPFGAAPAPYSAAPFREAADGEGLSDGEHQGLPRRVRQASLAPQLRGDPAFRQRQADAAAGRGAGAPESGGPSPEDIRATMSALQRGWQEGRSQAGAEGEPPWQTASEGGTDGTPA